MSTRQPSADVRHELQQVRPFRSDSQEALLSLLRTASLVSRRLGRVVEARGLSNQQYNVLRILRGAGSDGLPTLKIRDRMIEEGSTVTRLLDKLENAGYVERKRCRTDRRQVLCFITPDGLELLAELDPLIDAADNAAVSMLSVSQRSTLIELLGLMRTEAPGN